MRAQDRLLAILDCVGREGPLTLTEVAAQVEVPRPTVMRLLRGLETEGWITRDKIGSYRLGAAVVALANRFLSEHAIIAEAGRHMAELRDEVEETVSLSTFSGGVRLCVAEYASPHPLRNVHGVGSTAPMHSGASGRALLACLDDQGIERILAGSLPRYTKTTLCDRVKLEADIRLTRDRGWTLSRGERHVGSVAVAVPFSDPVSGVPFSLAIFAVEARTTSGQLRRWPDMLKESVRRMLKEVENDRYG